MERVKMMEELVSRCLELPLDERRALVEDLIKSINDEWRETHWQFLARGVAVIREKFGYDIRSRSHRREYVDLKMVYCYRMRQEGITYQMIGRYIGLDHSTVIHHVGKMRDALEYPNAFVDLVRKYNVFNGCM